MCKARIFKTLKQIFNLITTLTPYILLQAAVLATIAEGQYLTGDLGGKAKCSEFTKAIIDHL